MQFGHLDLSFGTLGSGLVVTDFDTKNDYARSVAINQSNGDIIVAGYTYNENNNYDFALSRYKPNGRLDASFGTSGTGLVISDFGGKNDYARSVAIDKKSGKIILAGYAYNQNNISDFALACYKKNGNLDTSFGTLGTGLVITDFNQQNSYAESVKIDAKRNKIIVAGHIYNSNNDYEFALACYDINGRLDASFGTLGNGKVITDFSGNKNDVGFSVAIDPITSKIIVAGVSYNTTSDYDFALACYNPDGRLDESFGNLGKVNTDIGLNNNYDQINSVSIDPKSGKIIVAGYCFGSNVNNGLHFALACYNPNGHLDASFGTLGRVITEFGGNIEDLAVSAAIDPITSKIIVAGHTYNANSGYDFALACYNPNGHLDASFGNLGTGLVISDFGGNTNNKAFSVGIDPKSGNIIVAGYKYNQTDDFVLASYYGEKIEVPLSSTCFPANTLISTNQGNIAIQNLNPEIHTIRNKKIELITKTITQDKYLVCFEKDCLGKNFPSEKTIITKNHLIYYKGSTMKAKYFINKFENVKKIKYNGEILYNVLLKHHDKMMVNNLICETLHPDNKIGELYKVLSKMSQTEQQKFIKEYNNYSIKNNIFSSKR